jgi:hypothetical protein
MSENRLSTLKRLWTPDGAVGDAYAMAFIRVRLISALLGLSMLILAPAAFLLSHFLHISTLAVVGVATISASLASMAALETSRIGWVLSLGRWTGWKGEPVWRDRQPMQFWSRTALHTTFLAIYAAAAAFLAWFVFGQMLKR